MEKISKNKLVMAKEQKYDNSIIIFSRPDVDSEWEVESKIKLPIRANQEPIFSNDLYLNDDGSRLYVEFTIDGVALTTIYNRDIENGKWDTSNLEFVSLKDLNIGS